jgi:DNA uptake protein ComE-like DNA-binding protein
VVVIRARLVVLGFLLPGVCLAESAQDQRPGAGGGSTASIRAMSPENRVDINTATLGDLLKIPGITRVWADRIVRFRPYRTKADLEEQGVVPVELYNRIKDSIVAHRPKQ